ncbi:hypothetical protein [Alienimonas sp. DA493]|uniref:hypothetical protein n=1 Tax=Alienimonas sp. DA493 TaxID=3373605 RepID=UPI0037544404
MSAINAAPTRPAPSGETLLEQERIIDERLGGYVEIGRALCRIQDDGLHPGKFIEYAVDRFGMKSHAVYRYIRASKVADELSAAGLAPPKNVGQAHRLHELAGDPEAQVNTWRRVVESGDLQTMSLIERAYSELYPAAPPTSDPGEEALGAGKVDLDSARRTTPPSESLDRLRRAAEELRAALGAFAPDAGDAEGLTDEIGRIAELLADLRSKLDPAD